MNTLQPPYDIVNALALAGSRRIVAVGTAPATGSFGSIMFTNPAGWNMFVAALDFAPPVLSIWRTNGEVTVAWPTAAAGYALETATDLSTTSVWSTNITFSSQTVIGATNYVSLPTDGVARFFRLRADD